ncbi:MAG: phage portal protein [Bacteroidota bacterium]
MTAQAEGSRIKRFVSRVKSWTGFSNASEKRSGLSPSDPYEKWVQLFGSLDESSLTVTPTRMQGIPAYGRAVDLISRQLASLPIGVHRKKEGGTELAEDHPLHKVLKQRPHPLYSSYDFRATLFRRLITRGNCYVYPYYVRGNLRELRFLGELSEIFERRGRYYYRFHSDEKVYRSEEILHFKQNSQDGICGMRPYQVYKDTLQRALAEIHVGTQFYKKGAQVSGLLVPDVALKPEQAQQAMDTWNKQNSGIDKIGQVGMVPFAFKYVKLGEGLDDSRYIEARNLTVQDISNMTGVPAVLLAQMDKATLNNVEQLLTEFVQFTLRDYAKIFEGECDYKLFTAEERGTYFIKLNFEGLLRGDTKTRAQYYQTMRNIAAMSPNEIRGLEGMNAYEGGDDYDKPLASNAKPAKTKTDEPAEAA